MKFVLDSVLNKHLDQMDALKAEADKAIDEVLSKIEIDELMDDPQAYLLAITEAIKEEVAFRMVEKAVDAGEALVKGIDKKDEIEVDGSADPKKNQELADDKSRG